MEGFKFSTIEEAVADLRAGKMIIAVDDPDRENEGDLICAAEHATLENVNFMASYAKGLICMPMDASYTDKLNLGTRTYGTYRSHRRPDAYCPAQRMRLVL